MHAAPPDDSFAAIVQEKREERRMSLRALAAESQLGVSHLSRALRRADGKRPSHRLMERIAKALDIDPCEFREYREERVVAWIRSDSELRDELFERLTKLQRP